jgi:hypothetical protein
MLIQFLRQEELIPLAEIGLAFTFCTECGHRQLDESKVVVVETDHHIGTIYRLVNLGFVQKEAK